MVPPSGVYLRALSNRVFIINRVKALSALTQESVESIIKVCRLNSNHLEPLLIISKTSFSEKLSIFS